MASSSANKLKISGTLMIFIGLLFVLGYIFLNPSPFGFFFIIVAVLLILLGIGLLRAKNVAVYGVIILSASEIILLMRSLSGYNFRIGHIIVSGLLWAIVLGCCIYYLVRTKGKNKLS